MAETLAGFAENGLARSAAISGLKGHELEFVQSLASRRHGAPIPRAKPRRLPRSPDAF